MRGMLAGLMRVVDTLVMNQARQPPVPQEAGGDPIVTPISVGALDPIRLDMMYTNNCNHIYY